MATARLLLAGAALLLSSAARAHDACGDVTIAGRALPSGLASLEPSGGGAPRGPVRLRGGAFCLKDVPPGTYRLTVTPLNLAEPLALVDAAVRVPGDRASFAAAALEKEGAGLDGALRFAGGPEPDLDAAPALVLGLFRGPGAPARYSFRWLTGKAGREVRFRLPPAAGALTRLALSAPGWARAGAAWTGPGGAARAELDAAPGARVAGTLRAPGGPAPRGAAALFMDLTGGRAETFPADADGAYEGDLPAGRYEVGALLPEGARLTGRPTFFATVPSTGAAVDVTLRPAGAGARVRTAPGLASASGHTDFVVAGPAGAARELTPCGLEAWEVFMNPAPGGRWVATLPDSWGGDPATAWTAPGLYDFHLVRVTELPRPSLRVLASAEGVALKDGAVTDVALERPAPAGRASVSGRFPGGRAADPVAARAAPGRLALCLALFPSVALYGPDGRLAATASAELDRDALKPLLESATAEDARAMAALAARPRGFRVEGLAPGRYRAAARMPGGAAWEAAVDLTDGEEARMDVGAPRGQR